MSIRLIASLLLFVMIGGIANAEESKQKTVKFSTELSEAFGKESLPGDQFKPKVPDQNQVTPNSNTPQI